MQLINQSITIVIIHKLKTVIDSLCATRAHIIIIKASLYFHSICEISSSSSFSFFLLLLLICYRMRLVRSSPTFYLSSSSSSSSSRGRVKQLENLQLGGEGPSSFFLLCSSIPPAPTQHRIVSYRAASSSSSSSFASNVTLYTEQVCETPKSFACRTF